MIYPDWRIRLVEKHLREGTQPSEDQHDILNLLSVFRGTCANKDASKEILECYKIYKYFHKTKELIEGCLMCEDATSEDIQQVTGLSETRIDVYSYFFFDIKVFTFRLLKWEYVRIYNNPEYPEGKEYKHWALDVGIEFFKWHTKVPGYEFVSKRMVADLVGDSFFRAKQHLGEPITSAVAKESLKWTKQAFDGVAQIHKLGQERSDEKILSNINIALKQIDYTEQGEDISDAQIIT